jgi:hypothetical protein
VNATGRQQRAWLYGREILGRVSNRAAFARYATIEGILLHFTCVSSSHKTDHTSIMHGEFDNTLFQFADFFIWSVCFDMKNLLLNTSQCTSLVVHEVHYIFSSVIFHTLYDGSITFFASFGFSF